MCQDDVQKIFDFLFSDRLRFLEIKKIFGKDFVFFTQSRIQKKNIDDFELSQIQEEFLVQSFLRRKLTLNHKTPKILLYNLKCIEASLNLDSRSADFLPEDLSIEKQEIAAKILSSKPFYLTKNSPQFLQAHPLVASNSIQTSPKSANYIAWLCMSMNDTPRLIQQVIESNYTIDEYSDEFLKNDIDVVLASLDKDPSSIKYIPTSVQQHEKVFRKLILLDICEYEDINKTKLSFLRKYQDDSLVITKCFDIMNAYCSEDEILKKRFNRILMDAIGNYPSIEMFDEIFTYYTECSWNDYKNHHPEYINVFNKICGELRHHDTYEDVEKISLLSNMKSVLGSKFEKLEDAMKSYFDIFHSNDQNNLTLLEEPKNMISKLSALYISKAKENHKMIKKNSFDTILDKYYSLKLDHPFIHSKIIEFRQKEELKGLFYFQDEKIMQFISNLENKYSKYMNYEELTTLIQYFIKYNYREITQIISPPALYEDYIKYKKVSKLVHRLNKNYISIDGPEVQNYKSLIDYNEGAKEYFYSGVTFSSSEIEVLEEFIHKGKIFNQIKRDISDFTRKISIDIDTIPPNKIGMFAKLVPFNDEYYSFDIESYYSNLTISKLSESFFKLSKQFNKDSFLDNDSYEILYELLVNKGIIWLMLFRDNRDLLTLYRLVFPNFNDQLVMQLINNMKGIVELSKIFHFDIQTLGHIFTINQMLQYVDNRTMSLLGKDIIKSLTTKLMFTDNDPFQVISMATDFVPRMLTRNKSTVPYVCGNTLNYQYSTYDSQDMDYLLSGIKTFACFRLNGNDNDFFHYCALNKNGVVIKITDHFGNFIARASGFRYGNSVFFNQLRSVYDDCGDPSFGSLKSEREDIIDAFQKACQDIVSISQNNHEDIEPIDFVFVTKSYILLDYPQNVSDRIAYEIGENPMDTVHKNWFKFVDSTPNLSESQGYRFFYTDYKDYSIICMASSKEDSIQPGDIKKYDVPEIYQRKRNSIVITDTMDNELFIKINRIKAAKSKLNEEVGLSEGEFLPVPISQGFIFLIGDNWYMICDSCSIIDTCLLENDEIASNEFNTVKSILNELFSESKYSECNQDISKQMDSIKVKMKSFII